MRYTGLCTSPGHISSKPFTISMNTSNHDGAVSASRGFLAVLLALTFVMNTVGRGVTETFAVFLLPVERALGATRSEITLTYSIYMLVHGLAAPFAGQLIDRLGARVTYAAGLLVLGLGYLAAGSATALWHYYLAVGLLGGLGAACLGMVAASSLLSRWFDKRMGSVLSVPYAAVGAGVLIIPPVTQVLLQSFGWQTAHRAIGAAILSLLPVMLLLPLARMTRGSASWQSSRADAARAGAGTWTLSAAIRTRAFWGLFFAYFGTSVAAYSVLPQSVAYLIEQGFDPLVAATAFGFTGALSAVGIVCMGWISDRVGKLRAVTVSYFSTMLGTISLLLVGWHPSLVLVYGFVVLFGLMQGVRGPVIVTLVAELYRGGAVGAIFGAMSSALGLGAALGSWLSGYLRDVTGSYTASFVMALAGSLLGLAMFWGVSSIRRERLDPDEHA
jgi:MFS family permease